AVALQGLGEEIALRLEERRGSAQTSSGESRGLEVAEHQVAVAPAVHDVGPLALDAQSLLEALERPLPLSLPEVAETQVPPPDHLPRIVDGVIEVAVPGAEGTERLDVAGPLEPREAACDADGRLGHGVAELVGDLLVAVEIRERLGQSAGMRQT